MKVALHTKPYESCITNWRGTLPKLHYTLEINLMKVALHAGDKPYLSCITTVEKPYKNFITHWRETLQKLHKVFSSVLPIRKVNYATRMLVTKEL